jgi:hypothetical protein
MHHFLLFISLLYGFLTATMPSLSAQPSVLWGQTGADTSPFIRQAVVAGGAGPATASEVSLLQAGASNQLLFQSKGEANTTTFRQVGEANRIELTLIGNGNRFGVEQLGNRNVLSLPDVRATNADVQLIQRGDGNQLIRQGNLSVGAGVQMRIEQTGGMKVMLTNGIL